MTQDARHMQMSAYDMASPPACAAATTTTTTTNTTTSHQSNTSTPSFLIRDILRYEGQKRKQRKARTAFSDHQLKELEASFEAKKYLTVQDRVELANKLKLSDTQVKTWYQNRRTKHKRQTAVGIELLNEAGHLFAYQSVLQQSSEWLMRQCAGPAQMNPLGGPTQMNLAAALLAAQAQAQAQAQSQAQAALVAGSAHGLAHQQANAAAAAAAAAAALAASSPTRNSLSPQDHRLMSDVKRH